MPIVFVAALFILVSDMTERMCVLHAVYASFLTGACPPIALDEVHTWVEADELQATMHARGLFVPLAVSRAYGSFTHAGAVEALYTFEVHECVTTGSRYYVDVVFDAGTNKRVALVETSQWARRAAPVTRTTASGIDEVAFKANEWVHLSANAWVR
jgi:hypothetical protein